MTRLKTIQLKGKDRKKLIQLKAMKDRMDEIDQEHKKLQSLIVDFIKKNKYQHMILVANDCTRARYNASSKKHISKELLLNFLTPKAIGDCTKIGKTYEYVTFDKSIEED